MVKKTFMFLSIITEDWDETQNIWKEDEKHSCWKEKIRLNPNLDF